MNITVTAKDQNNTDHHVIFKSISSRQFNKEWVSDELEDKIKGSTQCVLDDVFKKLMTHSQNFKYLIYAEPLEIDEKYISVHIFMEISDNNSCEKFDLFVMKIEKPTIFSSDLDKLLWDRFYSISQDFVIDNVHLINDVYYLDSDLAGCIELFNKIKGK